MAKQVEVRVVVEVRDAKRAEVRADPPRPELPEPEPEEGGYGHGV